MFKEMIRTGITTSRNYKSYKCEIEREISYQTDEQREAKVNEMYAECRRKVAEQMRIDIPN